MFETLQVQVMKQFDIYTVEHLARVASMFQSEIKLEYNNKIVDAKSIMGVLTLMIAIGSTVAVTAIGNDYQQAIEAISSYITKPPGV